MTDQQRIDALKKNNNRRFFVMSIGMGAMTRGIIEIVKDPTFTRDGVITAVMGALLLTFSLENFLRMRRVIKTLQGNEQNR